MVTRAEELVGAVPLPVQGPPKPPPPTPAYKRPPDPPQRMIYPDEIPVNAQPLPDTSERRGVTVLKTGEREFVGPNYNENPGYGSTPAPLDEKAQNLAVGAPAAVAGLRAAEKAIDVPPPSRASVRPPGSTGTPPSRSAISTEPFNATLPGQAAPLRLNTGALSLPTMELPPWNPTPPIGNLPPEPAKLAWNDIAAMIRENLNDKSGPVNQTTVQRLTGDAASAAFGRNPAMPTALGEPWGVRQAIAQNPGLFMKQPGQEGYDTLNPYKAYDPRTGQALNLGDSGRWSGEMMSQINLAEAGMPAEQRGLQYLSNPDQYINDSGQITPEGLKATKAFNASQDAAKQRKEDALDLQRNTNRAVTYKWNGRQAPMTADVDMAGIAALTNAYNAANRTTAEGEAGRQAEAELARLSQRYNAIMQDTKLSSDEKIARTQALMSGFNTYQQGRTAENVAGIQGQTALNVEGMQGDTARAVEGMRGDTARATAETAARAAENTQRMAGESAQAVAKQNYLGEVYKADKVESTSRYNTDEERKSALEVAQVKDDSSDLQKAQYHQRVRDEYGKSADPETFLRGLVASAKTNKIDAAALYSLYAATANDPTTQQILQKLVAEKRGGTR